MLVYNLIVGLAIAGAVQAVTVGSDFSFYYLWKYGRCYWNWYDRRETFEEFLEAAKYGRTWQG